MKSTIKYLFVLVALVSCVPSAKYQRAQDEIRHLQQENSLAKLYSDSVKESYTALKSDYNNLAYDFEETQRYVAFSDNDLLKELNKEKALGKRNADIVHQLQTLANSAHVRSVLRAETFVKDASCLLSGYSQQNFTLLTQNNVTLDIEALMAGATHNQPELRNALKELLFSMRNREDVIISVSLYQAGVNSNWQKVTLQQELIGFLVSEAMVHPSKVLGSTKLITKEKSLEFGISTDSKLLLEMEFKG